MMSLHIQNRRKKFKKEKKSSIKVHYQTYKKQLNKRMTKIWNKLIILIRNKKIYKFIK
jgi:hypothetical protein